jgi:glycosyltransferase involved in cell wall biosynthesis
VRILFLSDNFPPETNAPATRTYEHAARWVEAGHKVTIITCAPNFPEGVLYSGYENSWRTREDMNGIEVVRVKTYITANEGFVRRTLDYISFGLMACLAGLFEKRPDVVVTTSPQFFCACGGWLLSAIRRLPWVFELRDIWPASITAVGAMQDSVVIRLLEKMELFLYRRASRVVCVTAAFKTELINRGIDSNKIDVVLNGVNLRQYQPVEEKDAEFADQYDLQKKFVVGYVGTHGMAHALDNILDAAALLASRPEIVFLFAGSGAAREGLEHSVRERDLRNVVLIPKQPKNKMPALLSLCDVSLISLRDTSLFSKVIPSKMFESMGMGIPMIITCPEGEATSILRDTASGLVVPPEDPEALADTVLKLYQEPARLAALSLASSKAAPQFDRDLLASSMLGCLVSAT